MRRGEHAHALRSLAALAETYPRDERIAALLLRALASAGRPAEALERYESIRRQLADDLGATPSAELQRLHLRLLDDGSSESPEPAASRNHLPAPPPFFVERADVLSALDSHSRTRRGAIVAIEGAGGIGKTSLALHWAGEHRHEFPDGQLFVDLHGFHPSAEPISSEKALRAMLEMLGCAPSSIPSEPEA